MNKKKLEEQKQSIEKARKRKLQLTIFPTMAVAIVLVLIVGGIIPLGGIPHTSNNFTPPDELPWGSFIQISDVNFGSQVNIYYISWYGCPYGAADSWGFYLALQHYGNVSLTYPYTHFSNANDIYPNTPGLLFTHSVSYGNVNFDPIYLYNQTMTGTISNTPITGSLLSYGLNQTNAELPTLVAALEKDSMTTVPTQGFNGEATGIANGHVNTNVIITGSHGAWILNGALYNPSDLKGQSATTLKDNVTQVTYFINAANSIEKIIGDAQ